MVETKVREAPDGGYIVNKVSEDSKQDSGETVSSLPINGRKLTITLTIPSSLVGALELIIYFIRIDNA